jgi:hypothetical protein
MARVEWEPKKASVLTQITRMKGTDYTDRGSAIVRPRGRLALVRAFHTVDPGPCNLC